MTPARLIRRVFPGVILCAWLPLMIAGAHAESKTPPEVRPKAGTEPDSASILAARRDLEAIKAVKDARLSPALTGSPPRPALPELRTESGAVPPAALRAVKPEATNPNWLIDGMAQTERARRDRQQATGMNRGSARISADRDLGRSGTAIGSSQSVGQAAMDPLDSHPRRNPRGADPAERIDDSSLSEADEMKPSGVLNPLTRFLGDWMTPQDYALLRPSLEQAGSGGGVRSGDARFSLSGATDFAFDSSLQREIPGGFAATTPIPSEQPSRENPFLESLNRTEFTPPAQVAPTPGLPRVGLLPGSTAPVGPTPGNAAVMAPTRPNVPDFPKPGQDEKYFKQLKRF